MDAEIDRAVGLDRGSQPTDHHTLALALAQGIAPVDSHSAYEVVDADAWAWASACCVSAGIATRGASAGNMTKMETV